MDTQAEIVQPNMKRMGFIPNAGKKKEAMKQALTLAYQILNFLTLLITDKGKYSQQQKELLDALESEGILRKDDVTNNKEWLKQLTRLQKWLIRIIQTGKINQLEEWGLNLKGLYNRLNDEDSLKHFGKPLSAYGKEVIIG